MVVHGTVITNDPRTQSQKAPGTLGAFSLHRRPVLMRGVAQADPHPVIGFAEPFSGSSVNTFDRDTFFKMSAGQATGG